MANRRGFLKSLGAVAAGSALHAPMAAAAATSADGKAGHVVVVGGGYGGATAAKYLRMWSNGAVKVTLIERETSFVSCPISNLVIGGLKDMADITLSYDNLRTRWGVDVVTDEVVGIDVAKRELKLAGGKTVAYDRAVLSPGIDFMIDEVPGLEGNLERIPHAWKAGPQTVVLRKQLEAMEDGGVYAIHIPKAPYRCPPGPYERACLVANYLLEKKPRSKVMVLDSNPDIQSKKGLFTKAFDGRYKNNLEYLPNSTLVSVNAETLTVELDFSEVQANVLNIIPPHRAGRIVDMLGVELINGRWVDVDWLSMEAKGAPNVHVLGDAVFPAPTMPKSGHMANQHAKVAAAAILNILAGQSPSVEPVVMNTCYSFVDAKNAMHVASVHQFNAEQHTFLPAEGSGGVSVAANELEAKYALSWAQNIWSDMLS
ncbi:MAG: FAD-dependent oxidoreductase [Zoogloeaceae bacterium]|nr:FAD-dependent oxidoreductase [Zoogloeaceae bacterium]